MTDESSLQEGNKEIWRHLPSVPIKNATDFKTSDTRCVKLIIKYLFFSKSAVIRLNFDIFFRIIGDLVVD